MALSGLIVTDATGAMVAFGSPTVVATASDGTYEFDVTKSPYNATGNGATDDTAAIQAAIDAAEAVASSSSSPVTVFFPNGVYMATIIQVGGDGVTLTGEHSAKIKQLGGSGFNALVYLGADRTGIRNLEIDGNYPTVTPSGDGTGVLCGAFDDMTIDRCYVHNTKGVGIASNNLGRGVRITDTRVVEAGTDGINANSDVTVIRGCEIVDWGVVDASSNRAIQVDGQNADLDSLDILDTKIRMTVTDRDFTDAILVDCGDGDLTTGNPIVFGSSGAATEDGDDSAGAGKSYVKFTLDAGHGFQVGDMVWVDSSSTTQYNDIPHTIRSIGGTGNVFISVVDANTITLHATSAEARAGTPAVDLTSTGSGTFYVSSVGARRVTVTASTGVNTSTNRITCTSHGFKTGAMARLTVANMATDALPGGLDDAGTITLNTPFVSAGTGATYTRPKRINHVTLRGVYIEHASSNAADCNAIKVNNVNNLYFDDVRIHMVPDVGSNENSAIRLGQGLRKVQMSNCHLGGKLIVNNITWVPELTIDGCEIGDGANYPTVAIESIGCTRFTLRNSTLRFGSFGIRNSASGQHSDDKVEIWDVNNNVFEAFRSTRAQVFSFQGSTDFTRSGMISFYNNERRNVHPSYAGLSISSLVTGTDIITMSTHHQLKSGDLVQMVSASPPGGTVATAWYYIRKQSNTTLTLHTSLANVSADTRVDLTSAGSGSTLWSPQIGVQFSGNGFRDLYYMNQRGASIRVVYNEAAPTSASFAWLAGDQILKMDPASGASPGWICTASGSPGTWTAMANLA